MNTYIIEARSLDQGYPVSKTITADSEKEAKKIFEDDFGDGLDLINIFKVQENFMINYNLVLYIGLAFYALVFIWFIANEMNKGKLDREQWLSDQLTKSFEKQKEREGK